MMTYHKHLFTRKVLLFTLSVLFTLSLTFRVNAAPTVTAAAQNATNAPWQTVKVQNSDTSANGKVYIILDGTTISSVTDLDAAVAAHNGASASSKLLNLCSRALGTTDTVRQVYGNNYASYGAWRLIDGNWGQRWATNDTVINRLPLAVTIDFHRTVTFNGTAYKEQTARISGYEILYWNGTGWVSAYTGTTIGSSAVKLDRYPSVTASKMMFNITGITGTKGPTLWEIQAYNTDIDVSTADLNPGTYYAYAVDAAGNISEKGTNPITITMRDLNVPVVSVARQTVTNFAAQSVKVQSSVDNGKVYLILDGVTQVTVSDLDNAVTAGNGSKADVTAANTDVAVSTTGLTAGIYYAYAVDNSGRISMKSTNAVTVKSVALSTDATLSDIKVNGTTITGFSSETYSYNVELLYGSSLPTVTYTKTDAIASAVQTDITSFPGSTTIQLTAEDAIYTKTYTVNFTISPIEIASFKSMKNYIKPAVKNGGFSMDGYYLWCPSVIKVGDTYHMFASRWPAQYGMDGWSAYSECVRATSDSLCGPYTFQEVVLEKNSSTWYNDRVHNGKIVKSGEYYVLYFISSANETGYAYSKSITGPWTVSATAQVSFSNPAPLIKPDGSAYIFGRFAISGVGRIPQVYTAPAYNGTYTLQNAGASSFLPYLFQLEDPTIWWANNQYNVICTDFSGNATGVFKGGVQYYSTDGINYKIVNTEALYDRTKPFVFDDASSETFARIERPFIYTNEQGIVTALFNACLPASGPARIVVNPVDNYYTGVTAPPMSLKPTPGDAGQVGLTWTDISDNEDNFRIECSTDGSTWSTLTTVAANTTSCTGTGLTPAVKYYFRAIALSSAGNSEYSNIDSITVNAIYAPGSLTATPKSSTQIDLTWVDKSDNEDNFKIESSTDGKTWNLLTTLPANTTTYSNTGLSITSKYYYRMYATGTAGTSIYSNTADATTPNNDASLSGITVSEGTLSPAFAAGTYTYIVQLPYGTTSVPTVNATKSDANAQAPVITPVSSSPGATTIMTMA